MVKSINCQKTDFYNGRILVKALNDECKADKAGVTIVAMPLYKFEKDKRSEQHFNFIYKSNEYKIVQELKSIPVNIVEEIIFVRLCCNKHYRVEPYKTVKISDEKTGEEYTIEVKV
ncbi:hypothetical protein NUSPORA_02062 [Nucleospora cyclopteri]